MARSCMLFRRNYRFVNQPDGYVKDAVEIDIAATVKILMNGFGKKSCRQLFIENRGASVRTRIQ